MTTAILVPRRPDGGRRDQIWDFVRARWDGWNLHEGHHTDGPFNRSAAINQASRSAGEWDVAVIADSDSIVGADQLEQAVRACEQTGQMVLAYDCFKYVDEAMTDRILARYTGAWEPGVKFTMYDTCSSMVVVRRDVWDQARGFDEGFAGWGWEDVSFSHAVQTFGGGLLRVRGACYHLWHEPSTDLRDEASYAIKRARADRYHAAHGDPAAMRALIDELR